jgi:hypothetical protein
MLALVLACSGSSVPRVLLDDAGVLVSVQRGRAPALVLTGSDAGRWLDTLSADIVLLERDTAAPDARDSKTLEALGDSAALEVPDRDLLERDAIRTPDAIRAPDLVPPAPDALAVDVVSWGYRDDAGVFHCEHDQQSGSVACGYRMDTATASNVKCYRSANVLPAPCRWGAEGAASWQWYVNACADCAGLERWTTTGGAP